MTKDPICRITVDEAMALHAEHNGQMFYFCSEHCRKKFPAEAQPATVGESSCCGDHEHHRHGDEAVKPSSAAKYFCPMCPGVESDKPGDCPECGMALERNAAAVALAAGKVIYTCPMHPEVQQDHPGNCPKCGMALVLKTPAASPDQAENDELQEMTQRFWIGAALTLPVFVLAMVHIVPALAAQSWADSHASRWIQFALTTPV